MAVLIERRTNMEPNPLEQSQMDKVADRVTGRISFGICEQLFFICFQCPTAWEGISITALRTPPSERRSTQTRHRRGLHVDLKSLQGSKCTNVL